MIIIKTSEEIEKMRRASRAVAETLQGMEDLILPGVRTGELDRYAEESLRDRGVEPAFKGYRGYPGTICASRNEVVVHGIPGDEVLQEGDIISIDLGGVIDGYYGDSAVTFPVGEVSPEAQQLMDAAGEALERGIEQTRVGKRLYDISWAIQSHAEENNFHVVRDYVGHGIGRNLHEDPQVPNFGTPDSGPRLREGMVLAIEPMVNQGTWQVELKRDGWAVVTADGRLSAHFEHTVAIQESGPDVLTRWA
jgi:methionyl aminopeptidase